MSKMKYLFAERIFWFFNLFLGIESSISITAIRVLMESYLCNEKMFFHCINRPSTLVN
ncbi:hypothetical protein LL036_10880 [Clostridium sp. CF011]|nr:hypothetical protein LL036_10880 [Clostridium sp. CF011]